MKMLSRAGAKKKTKGLKGFKTGTFIGRFQMTVKGLRIFTREITSDHKMESSETGLQTPNIIHACD